MNSMGIERVFYLCQTFVLRMCDGGIESYYSEAAGNFANETVESIIGNESKTYSIDFRSREWAFFKKELYQKINNKELKN